MVTNAVTAVRAAYATTILGTAYAKDQSLTGAQIAAIPHIDALLGKGILYLSPDRHGRKPSRNYNRPSHIDPIAFWTIGGSVGPHMAEGGEGAGPMLMSVEPDAGAAPAEGGGGALDVSIEAHEGNRVTLSVSGGTAPYSYDWGDDSTAHVQRAHSYQFAGQYEITVTDAEGATGSTAVGIA